MAFNQIKEAINHLNFCRKAFTKKGFRHVINYISGLISLAKKTVKKIAQTCPDEKSSAMNRILTEAKFEKELFEEKYLKKLRFMFSNSKLYLLIDDTLIEHNGKSIEEAQNHFDHSTNRYLKGHQFFTAILYTPLLQLPIFPELYSKNTDSKIEMANKLVNKLVSIKLPINTILFDSWYSDQELIKTCLNAKIRVVCAIKTNRKIKLFKSRKYYSLSFISKQIRMKKLDECKIGDNKIYCTWSKEVWLNKLPLMRLVTSHELIDRNLSDHAIHLISSNLEDSVEEILKTYKIRWHIETYHRDIKQNLGFAKAFFRKKEGIVRHAIFVALAYATLRLFMYVKGLNMTIGDCCEYLKNKAECDLVANLIDIEDKATRINCFKKIFIS